MNVPVSHFILPVSYEDEVTAHNTLWVPHAN
jgi:hypothetical protein